jgi:hypothetical protein
LKEVAKRLLRHTTKRQSGAHNPQYCPSIRRFNRKDHHIAAMNTASMSSRWALTNQAQRTFRQLMVINLYQRDKIAANLSQL